MSANSTPIIIKRKKVVGGDGHHGGAWKVAYADFVTAMMAFFLLMWLLNATTESQRKGLADYFSPTIPLSRVSGGGEGSFGGDSVFSDETMSQSGTGGSRSNPTEQRKARGVSGVAQISPEESLTDDDLENLEDALMARGGESLVTEMALRHVITRVTDEGLVIEVFDQDDAMLFDPDTGEATETLLVLMGLFTSVFDLVTNPVAIQGHIRAKPIIVLENEAWVRSTVRADQARTLLEANGLEPDRVARITGFADRKPVARNPMAIRNNRLEFILLRSDV